MNNYQCSEYYSAFTGLVKCPCKPLRIITYTVADEPVSGDYCAKHAIELRRDEARGKLEILSDEPLYPFDFDKPVAEAEKIVARLQESIPFTGEPVCT